MNRRKLPHLLRKPPEKAFAHGRRESEKRHGRQHGHPESRLKHRPLIQKTKQGHRPAQGIFRRIVPIESVRRKGKGCHDPRPKGGKRTSGEKDEKSRDPDGQQIRSLPPAEQPAEQPLDRCRQQGNVQPGNAEHMGDPGRRKALPQPIG